MMTTISALLFLISLCVITMGYAHAQKMAVELIDSLTKAPVTIAYIIPVEDQEYAVTNKESTAYTENKRRDAGISPIHYPDKRIRLATLGAGVHTMCTRPKSPVALGGFVITNQADKTRLGTWILKIITAPEVKHTGTAERKPHKNLPVQVPEYRGDRSFRASVRNRPLVNGSCPAVKNQLDEKVAEASSKALANLDNWLVAAARKGHKALMVSC
ncbi:hypothetical protein PQ465_02140 [Sphingobacterium oryzagri]|uniref:DUF4468 domain-containing protein n=1 Tax=Sphingobacterium oryzagri TaxID=3025669 RepID=A0ABY7WLA7_9SPHI|nr:hypothetical protein [Sphingobacterium sp. KACC 22765]WDF69193.1 hypothetical protein PQ465_02140 [Sphingobacterium sp. KACC 22765]